MAFDGSLDGKVRFSVNALRVPDQFTTARIAARRMAPEHLADLRRMHSCEPMMRFIGGTRDEAASAAYLERHVQHWAEHGFGFWMLHDASTGASAGLAGLRCLTLDGAAEIEVGYGLLPEFWGRGLASEIAAACVDAGFGKLDATSLVAITHPDNDASQHVLRKLGFNHDRDLIQEGKSSLVFRAARPASRS